MFSIVLNCCRVMMVKCFQLFLIGLELSFLDVLNCLQLVITSCCEMFSIVIKCYPANCWEWFVIDMNCCNLDLKTIGLVF